MLTSVTVLQPITFPAGAKLRLMEGQAAPRLHRLKSLGKGLYEAAEPVQFKAGERLDLDPALLPKALRDGLAATPRVASA